MDRYTRNAVEENESMECHCCCTSMEVEGVFERQEEHDRVVKVAGRGWGGDWVLVLDGVAGELGVTGVLREVVRQGR